MLKIIDDVDLKELEKFGFKSDHYGNYTIFNDYNIDVITVWTDRTMDISGDSVAINTFYDLMQAGLVEKLKEE